MADGQSCGNEEQLRDALKTLMISFPSPTCFTVALSPDSNNLFFASYMPLAFAFMISASSMARFTLLHGAALPINFRSLGWKTL